MSALTDVFTVTDVARLIQRLDGATAITARAVRYYARTGMVEPTARVAGARGARLYTLADVAMLRLAILLRTKWKLHERAVWGLLVYRGSEIRAHITDQAGVIVIDDTAAVSPGSERPIVRLPIRVPVMFVLEGLRAAADRHRRQYPNVWTGASWMTPDDAARSASA